MEVLENSLINDYCGVTYLYSEKRPTCDFTIPDLKGRRVVDLKKIVFATWWNVPIHAFSSAMSLFQKRRTPLERKKCGPFPWRPKETTGSGIISYPLSANFLRAENIASASMR